MNNLDSILRTFGSAYDPDSPDAQELVDIAVEQIDALMREGKAWELEIVKDVEKYIAVCEGKHIQQVAYSTYHKALTQICFGCKKIRTSFNPYLESEE